MIYHPTAAEWRAAFPEPPRDPEPQVIRASELQATRFAIVTAAITIDAPWPGLHALDDQDRRGSMRFSLGRWYVDDLAVSRIDEQGGDYDVDLDRIAETDWIAHMLDKPWLYDPTDFIDTLEAARQLSFPQQSSAWLDDLLWQDVANVIQRGEQPYFPSRMQDGNRTYLVSRMTGEQKHAFCDFLANQHYAIEH